jgi:serine phosphatase RsbU (regulator of sigma subunit)
VNEEAMVTCAVVRLEYATRMLTWACAGHPPPVLVGPGTASLLETTTGAPLGVGGRETYRCTTRSAVPGESIFLYTDGLIERRGENLTTGFERLIRAAAAHSDGAVDALIDGVLAELAPGSHDDIAVLAVRVC